MEVRVLLISGIFLLLGIHQVNSDAVPWSYAFENLTTGPDHWKDNFPDCNGVMQSPINIDTSRVLYTSFLEPFDLSEYRRKHGVTMALINKDGHTAEVMLGGKPIHLMNGNLPATYKLDQFHFHWGKTDKEGSEHSVDGKHYPLEIGEKNEPFEELLSHFHLIKEPGKEVTIPTFALSSVLPKIDGVTYYRYFGSLTTPPCYETVIWSLATDVITLSEEQIGKFRSLLNLEHEFLVNDYRPTQPLNHRSVTTNLISFDSCPNCSTCLSFHVFIIVTGILFCWRSWFV